MLTQWFCDRAGLEEVAASSSAAMVMVSDTRLCLVLGLFSLCFWIVPNFQSSHFLLFLVRLDCANSDRQKLCRLLESHRLCLPNSPERRVTFGRRQASGGQLHGRKCLGGRARLLSRAS